MTLFGVRASNEVVKIKWDNTDGLKSNIPGILIKRLRCRYREDTI